MFAFVSTHRTASLFLPLSLPFWLFLILSDSLSLSSLLLPLPFSPSHRLCPPFISNLLPLSSMSSPLVCPVPPSFPVLLRSEFPFSPHVLPLLRFLLVDVTHLFDRFPLRSSFCGREAADPGNLMRWAGSRCPFVVVCSSHCFVVIDSCSVLAPSKHVVTVTSIRHRLLNCELLI